MYKVEYTAKRTRIAEAPTIYENTPQAFAHFGAELIGNSIYEQGAVVLLNTKLKPISCSIVAKGDVNYCNISMRMVFTPAILQGAYAVIFFHNHPSGDVTPSYQDIDFTRKLIDAGKILQIPVLDHIIVGEPGAAYTSLKQYSGDLF